MTDRKLDQMISDWLEAEAPKQVSDRVLRATFEQTRKTRQQVGWRVLPRRLSMPRLVPALASAAIVLVVAVIGYQYLPAGNGPGGTNATPLPPRLPLLARGEFVTDGFRVFLAAIADGSRVKGRMFVGERGAEGFGVDLQCTRTTEDGLIMIGGYTEEGTPAAIVLQRGTPVEATIWSQRGGPESQAASCLAFLDERLIWDRSTHPDGDWLEPIEGFVELGTNATPAPSSALLARGDFVTAGGGARVELEATGEGSSVTGRMTVSEEGYAFTVDLQCTRTTEDGLIMIGGYTIDTAGGGSGISPEGTLAGIVLERGSPVGAGIWSQRGGPTSQAASCLAFLDEQLMWDRSTHPDGNSLDPIEGTVELGP